MKVAEPAEGFLVRLDEVAKRLAEHADRPPAGTLTAPEPGSGERWEWGQVWAHVAEFPSYWVGQIRKILDSVSEDAVAFGRVKTDPVRVGAIEAGRSTPPPVLWQGLSGDLDEVRSLLGDMRPEDWRRLGRHPRLGLMEMPTIVEEFLVGHLEEHAGQLDLLASQ